MSRRALLGDVAIRLEQATSFEELKRVLVDEFSSAAPIVMRSPLLLNNTTNSPGIKITNTGRDNHAGILVQDKSGRETQLGIGLGTHGVIASEVIPDPNYFVDPSVINQAQSGQPVGSGYGNPASGTGIWKTLVRSLKGGWGRFFDSYHKSFKTWHPPNTADQFSMNGNRRWMIDDPCGFAIVHCRVNTVNDDTLTCTVIDNNSDNGPANILGSQIIVCKPWWLMRTPFDGQTIDGISYAYNDHQHRTANNGATTENQVVHPLYKGSDMYGNPSEIYARWSCNGTDVANVWYIDLNTDARTWVVE